MSEPGQADAARALGDHAHALRMGISQVELALAEQTTGSLQPWVWERARTACAQARVALDGYARALPAPGEVAHLDLPGGLERMPASLRMPFAEQIARPSADDHPAAAAATMLDGLRRELFRLAQEVDSAGHWTRRLDEQSEGQWAGSLVGLGKAATALDQTEQALPQLAAFSADARVITARELSLSRERRAAFFRDQRIQLTPKTFGLMETMIARPTDVLTKRELREAVWGEGWQNPQSRTVDCHVSRLRQAIEEAGAPAGRYVINEWGVGYRLMAPEGPGQVEPAAAAPRPSAPQIGLS